MPKATRGIVETADKAHIARDRRRKEQAPWYILRPVSTFMTTCDLTTAVALVYTAIATPVEVAFLDPPDSITDSLFLINRLIDLVFLSDMAMQFFSALRVVWGVGHGGRVNERTCVSWLASLLTRSSHGGSHVQDGRGPGLGHRLGVPAGAHRH